MCCGQVAALREVLPTMQNLTSLDLSSTLKPNQAELTPRSDYDSVAVARILKCFLGGRRQQAL